MLQQQGTSEHDVDYSLMTNGLVIFRDRIDVIDIGELKKLILMKFHVKPYSGHPRYQNTLKTSKKFYH